ncbi:hypothetical protein Pla144_27130 [Bythopirellula polymerisocia]|uniref:Uncharacterized protein n=1 Tax=Bythopirellula polymerisocia TaxID=2528003 RepID=A0A5C6CM77_9BACT|nr:hypothetical protein Pla144_27130 [Bythopirellula polymerisocia]
MLGEPGMVDTAVRMACQQGLIAGFLAKNPNVQRPTMLKLQLKDSILPLDIAHWTLPFYQ